MSFLQDQLHSPVIGGGLVLMASGAVMATFRKLPNQIYEFVKKRVTVEVEVLNNDPLFDYVTMWLDNHPYSKKSRRLTATTSTRVAIAHGDEDGPNLPSISGNDNRKIAKVFLSPAPGKHVFFYNSRLMILQRSRDKGETTTDSKRDYRQRESYEITLLGKNQAVLRELIEEVVQFGSPPAHSIRLHTSRYGYWQSTGIMQPRPIESVILPKDLKEKLLADVRKFLASAAWYREVGIPWHRGYLFHGLPGSGKTSIVSALAGELGMDLYLLNLGGSTMDDEKLASLMADVRPGTIILMEDVDCTVPDREAGSETRKVTLSGLLNCLDGVQSREGCLVFMTTNYRDKLDSAMTRPGRVDVDVEFGPADEDQIRRLRDRLAPQFSDESLVALRGKTMAEVQKALLDSPASSLDGEKRSSAANAD